MAQRYPIPAQQTRVEIKVLNSRFIATAAPVFTIDEAKDFINQIKAEYSDASHNVPAYIIGYGSSVTAHCNDDGEPSGTAGRPVLSVLQGSGLGDAAIVVTRYFGGTKLGTGGLVRAYSGAAKEVLAAMPKAEKVATYTAMVVLPYHLFERAKLLVEAHQGQILDEEFTADVTLSIQFAVEHFPEFQTALREMTHGSLEAEIIETNPDTIMPIK
ncbi:MAG: YigZ family protein [Candidatus Promineifilaceae bacterium]|nr:YigZ family protein [Candidatus Promineifilaceae bacterium]